jgi:hypothetical protein
MSTLTPPRGSRRRSATTQVTTRASLAMSGCRRPLVRRACRPPAKVLGRSPEGVGLCAAPNAVIKISGACTLFREPYPFPGIWHPLARVFDAWGFDRCSWGTDWTGGRARRPVRS